MKKRRSRMDEPLLIGAIVVIILTVAVGMYFATRRSAPPSSPAKPLLTTPSPPAKPVLTTKTWIHGVCIENDPGNGTCKQANYNDDGIAFSEKYDDRVEGHTHKDIMEKCKKQMKSCGRNFRNKAACCGPQNCKNITDQSTCNKEGCTWNPVGCGTQVLF